MFKTLMDTAVNPFLIDMVSIGISPLYPKLKATQLLLTRSCPVNQWWRLPNSVTSSVTDVIDDDNFLNRFTSSGVLLTIIYIWLQLIISACV